MLSKQWFGGLGGLGGRLSAAVAAAVLAITVLVAWSAPASASGMKCYNDSPTDPWWSVCVDVYNGRVSGFARWYYSDGLFNPATVYVVQCRVDMTACGTISANRASGSNIVSVSSKPAAYGHVYHACTSFSVYLQGHQYNSWAVNYCSPWSSWP
jgi:hypothetical protein